MKIITFRVYTDIHKLYTVNYKQALGDFDVKISCLASGSAVTGHVHCSKFC